MFANKRDRWMFATGVVCIVCGVGLVIANMVEIFGRNYGHKTLLSLGFALLSTVSGLSLCRQTYKSRGRSRG